MWRRLAPAAVLAAAPAWVLTYNPTDRDPDPTGDCLWHNLTGINGPSCGGTRMFWYLLHGNLPEAARPHLPALIAAPFLLYSFIAWIAGILGRPFPALRPSRTVLIAYAAFWIVFTLARNLPWPPLTWFAIPDLQ